jgi:hypothetical protein
MKGCDAMPLQLVVEAIVGAGWFTFYLASRYKFNMSPETEVDDFDHHIENVPYATILYHPSFLLLFHNSHHVFR